MGQQFLNDGDQIIFHYTDDWTKEKDTDPPVDLDLEFTTEFIDVPKYFELDEDADITAEATNNSSSGENMLLIVALYNNQEEMINYSYANKKIQAAKIEKLTAGLKIPASGKYTVKAFIWVSQYHYPK